MFNGEYNAQQINDNQSKIRATRKACIACAKAFSPEVFLDCADRINNRTKLVNYLNWIAEYHVIQGSRVDWIKQAMRSYRLSFKTGLI